MKVNRTIFVTFRKEGIHKYPAAATDPNLATGKEDDVSFLSYIHRHIFHFNVKIEIFHDDRDIEFIQFKRWLESRYDKGVLDVSHQSCEMMAEELIKNISAAYPGRDITVEISEDGENGAILEYINSEQPSAENYTPTSLEFFS